MKYLHVKHTCMKISVLTKIISEVCFSEIILVKTRLPLFSDYCTVS